MKEGKRRLESAAPSHPRCRISLGLHSTVVLFVTVFFLAQGLAQDQIHGRVEGSVVRHAGGPIENALVRLVNLATQVEHARNSGPDGRFLFNSLETGSYGLDVCYKGFCRRFAAFSLRLGQAEWIFPPFELLERYVSLLQIEKLRKIQSLGGLSPELRHLQCEMEECYRSYTAVGGRSDDCSKAPPTRRCR